MTPRPLAHCDPCACEVAAIQAWKNGRTVGRYRAQYVYVCPQGHTVEPYALPAAAAIDWSMPGQRIGDRVKPLSPKTMARIEAGLRKYGNPGRPFMTQFRQRVRDLDPALQPFPTVVSDGANHALVVPVEGRDGKQARSTAEAMRTMTARAETALVVPYQSHSNAYLSSSPFGAMTTIDPAALFVPSGGTWRESATSSSEPFATVTTRETDGVAFIANLKGDTSRPWGVDEPLSTVQANGNHHMLVRHNSSKGDGGEMCTPASEPIRTLTTAGHQSLVSIERQVEDATFRMLEPHEIQRAMAFHDGYRVLGNRRERVRQLGNGVTPPAAEFLLRAVAASLDVA